jgi:dipeptidyl aminopeptidase/acylaminoacyl peptidase
MAEMHPIVFNARDGLKLHGYLTIPVGAKPSNLPLVVLPHGGPWVRDIWAFNPLIQMLANRGYAVLQVNYRGSAGYGRDFSEKGRKEVGGAIQTDIEDATRWAIGRKIADPKRIAIMGASYGGYSTLYALGKTPELYRCGIAVSAVTDWMRIYRGMGDESAKFARKYWCEEIGDPEVDNARLNEISPVNFAASITAPLLIVHGEADTVVPFKQAKLMVAALRKAGHPPETLFIADENHHIKSEESRIAEYKAIEAFLEKHLGSAAAVPVVSPQAK